MVRALEKFLGETSDAVWKAIYNDRTGYSDMSDERIWSEDFDQDVEIVE